MSIKCKLFCISLMMISVLLFYRAHGKKHNIKYYYGVSLVSVSWVSGTHYIRYISGSPTDAIDMNADTFEAKLLNLDTAVAAITERFGEPKNIKELIKQR